jgi:alkylated DNA repair dioxygenase AlkB
MTVCHEILNHDGQVFYYPQFLIPKQATHYFHTLLTELSWQQETVTLFGKCYPTPRLIAWYGNPGIGYRYSGIKHVAPGWPLTLATLRQQLETLTSLHFNSVLANLYRDGRDSMGWHADNEKTLGKNPTIASVSLGQTRRFLFKHRTGKNCIELLLEPGSLLLMQGELQTHWLHSLPKQRQANQARLNLTFRTILA